MKEIPQGFRPYRQTSVFTQATVPAGLLRSHRTKAGRWGKITVVKGALRYRILTEPVEELVIQPNRPGIIEPEVPHEITFIEANDETEFFVEFFMFSTAKSND